MVALAVHTEPPFEPVQHRVVARWPSGAFIENIAVLNDGRFALTVHNQRKLLRVDRSGGWEVWAELKVSAAGVVAYGDGALVVGGEIGEAPHGVFHIHADGTVEHKLAIPGAVFLNGFTPAAKDRAYTVDSLNGQIIEIDVARWTARVALADQRLTKASGEPMVPGVNGIKAGDGCLWLTNTDRALVLRASLSDAGDVTGLSVLADGLRGDDLALDTDGRLYITNHIHNTLTRLEPDGAGRVAIAGPDQGMAGSTACAFHPDDPGALYVTTTGGLFMPYDGVPQDAKLVRLEVGASGRPLPALR